MIAFGIVTHPDRYDAAMELALGLPHRPPVHMSVDHQARGPVVNHRKAWEALARKHAEWGCVLEDDALPVAGFAEQLAAALAVTPSPVVSLYLGTGRPPAIQPQVRAALERAERLGACWITASRMLHAVAICLRGDLIADMLARTERTPARFPADERWDGWLARRRLRVAYAVPSLVNHADGPTLVDHPDRQPRSEPRQAWRTGRRMCWSGASVPL